MGEIAAILSSTCGVADRAAESFSLDSRTLARGSLFFAIRGARLDGHQFVVQAFERGTVAAVVERDFYERAPAELRSALMPVADTTLALQRLAQAVRRKWGRRIVAVTGSTGKTTTKELIAAVLATRLNVHRSAGNLNNQFGVPLTLLALESGHDVAVLEMGMSAAGEIARLAEIAGPEIGVVTNVAPVHLEFFDSIEDIARAKRELIENLQRPGTAVLNYDDARVRSFQKGFSGRAVTYGFSPGAHFRALNVTLRQDRAIGAVGTSFHAEGPHLRADFFLPLAGRHNVENALAAMATASLFRSGERWLIDERDIRQALGQFKPLRQRAQILALANDVTVIDDSYNSNPRAMEQMLETLAAWPGAGRKIVVAGEMLELGPSSSEWHRSTGRKCAEARVDWLLGVQGEAKSLIEGAIAAGLAKERTRFFVDALQAAQFCQALVCPEDVVLVKGSRGVHLERVAEALGLAAAHTARVTRQPSMPVTGD